MPLSEFLFVLNSPFLIARVQVPHQPSTKQRQQNLCAMVRDDDVAHMEERRGDCEGAIE
jgi:hypothetical protein